MKNPLTALADFGQSPWIDMISREMIESGSLKKKIDEDGLKGLTSNPSIFEKSISKGADYDEGLRAALSRGLTEPKDLFEAVAIRDIRDAAAMLMPVYKSSSGRDGYVSLEVSPRLAYDTEKTIAEGKRLFAQVDRRNLMIKVPATIEGLPAIRGLLTAGVNVNCTLIFSITRYQQVMEAFVAGLEARAAADNSVAHVASVASFFVSRIDSAVDKEIEQKQPGSPLLGKIALANATIAYEAFKEVFASRRFAALKEMGARVQRPLWASTSTKNPKYSDVLYVEELIGPETVNTIPPKTWAAFKDHGRPRASLEEGVAEARRQLEALKAADVDLDAITDALEKAGVESFSKSFKSLLDTIETKVENLCPKPKKEATPKT